MGAQPSKPKLESKKKIADAARRIIVEVGLQLKSFDRSSGIEDENYYRFVPDYSAKDLARNRQRRRLYGVLVSTDGTFVARTLDFDWKHVESVVAVDSEGKESPARPVGISRRGRLMWFKAEGLARPLPELLRRPAAPGMDTVTASGGWNAGRRTLSIVPQSLEERQWLGPDGARQLSLTAGGAAEPVDAVFTKEGDWLGVDPGYYGLQPDGTWRVNPAELAADRIPWEQYQAGATRQAAALESGLPLVHLRFRVETGAPTPGEAALFSDKDEQAKALKERSDAGLVVRRGLVFVPNDLDRDLVRRLESVVVTAKGATYEGKFVGVVRELEGYLVEFEDGHLPALGAPGDAVVPKDGELFLASEVRYFGGHVDLRQHPEFFDGRQRAYRDVETRRLSVGEAGQTAVFSAFEGRPIGVALRQRRYEAEPEKDTWREPKPIGRVFSMAELEAAFADPQKAIDPLLQPQPLEVVRRKPWLGVETQGVSPDLARELKIERETVDGTRGQMITFVYPDSPAEQLKLQPGDLLLKLRDKAKKDELPIGAEGETSDESGGGRWWRSWFVRKTPLTEALEHLGVGTKAQLTYAHNHAVRTADVTLAEGPPDFESAEKYKAPRTGMTAKDITYDVRNILRLQDVKGVLVYDVDSGSPANIAEIDPMDLIVAVDNRPVASLAEFKQIIEQEQLKGTETVRLRLRYLNDTRFADLKFSARGEKEGPALSVMDADPDADEAGGDGGDAEGTDAQ